MDDDGFFYDVDEDPIEAAYEQDPTSAHAAVAHAAAEAAAREVMGGFAAAAAQQLSAYETAAQQVVAVEASRAMEQRYGSEVWAENRERVGQFIAQRPYLIPPNMDAVQVADAMDTAMKAVLTERRTTDIAEFETKHWDEIKSAGHTPYYGRKSW